MKLRKLNYKGIEQFREYINDLRGGIEQNVPLHLLDGDEFSEDIEFDVELPTNEFKSRYEMGICLVDLFKDQKRNTKRPVNITGLFVIWTSYKNSNEFNERYIFGGGIAKQYDENPICMT